MLQLAASSILGLTVPHAPHAPPRCLAASRAASPVCVDDKSEVEEYFNNEGFNRWNRIYSEDGEVNTVQLDIRTGHAQTVDKVLGWVDADGTAKAGETFCDAGCGVGSLSLPLAHYAPRPPGSGRNTQRGNLPASLAASAGHSGAVHA